MHLGFYCIVCAQQSPVETTNPATPTFSVTTPSSGSIGGTVTQARAELRSTEAKGGRNGHAHGRQIASMSQTGPVTASGKSRWGGADKG